VAERATTGLEGTKAEALATRAARTRDLNCKNREGIRKISARCLQISSAHVKRRYILQTSGLDIRDRKHVLSRSGSTFEHDY